MSVSKVKFIKNCSLPLSEFIEIGRLKYFNKIHNKTLKVSDVFELNEIKEYLPKQLLIEKTYFHSNLNAESIDIDYTQNLLEYPSKEINFISVKINFVLLSPIYSFHYPNEDCNYLLEDMETKHLLKINPLELDDNISVLNVS